MWKEGTIGTPKKEGKYKGVKYRAKYPEESSEDYGINGSKISKLSSKMNSGWIVNYDRDWDVKSACERANIAPNILLDESN